MRKIREFDEFELEDGLYVRSDMGSAFFEDGVVYVEGKCNTDDETKDVTLELIPEDTAEFNVTISSTDGKLVGDDLMNCEAELSLIETVDGEVLYDS